MQRDEILERSRNEKADEGMVNAENRGRKIGFTAFCLMFIVLLIFIMLFDKSKTIYAVLALFWAYMSAEAFVKYRFAKKKAYMVTTIAGGIASLVFLADYMLTTLGIMS